MYNTPQEYFDAILAEWNTLEGDKAAINTAEAELSALQTALVAKENELAAAREEYIRSTELVNQLFTEVEALMLGVS